MSLYATWKVNEDEEYKLVLEAQQICELEDKFNGKNLMSVIGDASTGMPSLRTMILVTHSAMTRFHHGKKLTDVYDAYNRYIQNGKSQVEFYTDVYVPIFQASGFFPKDEETVTEETEA